MDEKKCKECGKIKELSMFSRHQETPDDIDFKRCWSLSNLQPLWAKDNHIKKDKLIKPFQPSLLLQEGR